MTFLLAAVRRHWHKGRSSSRWQQLSVHETLENLMNYCLPHGEIPDSQYLQAYQASGTVKLLGLRDCACGDFDAFHALCTKCVSLRALFQEPQRSLRSGLAAR